jgi:hypothetical protein
MIWHLSDTYKIRFLSISFEIRVIASDIKRVMIIVICFYSTLYNDFYLHLIFAFFGCRNLADEIKYLDFCWKQIWENRILNVSVIYKGKLLLIFNWQAITINHKLAVIFLTHVYKRFLIYQSANWLYGSATSL